MNVTQQGIFLQALSWSMEDDKTGEMRSGTTIRLGVDLTGDEYNPTKGYVIQKYTGPSKLWPQIDQSMVGKRVDLNCELVQRGNNAKFIPQSMTLTK